MSKYLCFTTIGFSRDYFWTGQRNTISWTNGGYLTTNCPNGTSNAKIKPPHRIAERLQLLQGVELKVPEVEPHDRRDLQRQAPRLEAVQEGLRKSHAYSWGTS